MVSGNNIVISIDVDGTIRPVAASRSCTMDIKRDKIAVANPFSGKHMRYIPTMVSVDINIGTLIADSMYIAALNARVAGDSVLPFRFNVTDSLWYEGELVIDSTSIGGELNRLATNNVHCTVSGGMTQTSLYSLESAEVAAAGRRIVDANTIDNTTEEDILMLSLFVPEGGRLSKRVPDSSVGLMRGKPSEAVLNILRTGTADDLAEAGVVLHDPSGWYDIDGEAGVYTLFINSASDRGLRVVSEV